MNTAPPPLVDKMKHIRAMQAAMRGKQIYKEGASEFVGGGSWEIVTQFKGKSHKDGGIDLEVTDGVVRRISGTDDIDDIAKNGRIWRSIAAGAYGAGEGLLDTLTLGATDQLTDWGYEKLQDVGGSSADEKREQDSVRGYATTAGAITGAVLTGGANTGSAIQQGAKGIGAGVLKGSPDSKFAQQVGMYLPLAGEIAGMALGNTGYAKGSKMADFARYANVAGKGFGMTRQFFNAQNASMRGAGDAGYTRGINPMMLASSMMGETGMGGDKIAQILGTGIGRIGGGSRDGTPSSPQGDVFYAQVPMREDTLAQLTKYNINV